MGEVCPSSDAELGRDAAVLHVVFDESRMLEAEHVVSREQSNDLVSGMYVRAWCWHRL